MMREILFRGKRVDNGEWVEGYYIKDSKGINFIVVFDTKNNEDWYPVIPETVSKYTSLKDKNNKKIFIGDRLFITYSCGGTEIHGTVEQEDDGRIIVYYSERDFYNYAEINNNLSKYVIGTVHDNHQSKTESDLLKRAGR